MARLAPLDRKDLPQPEPMVQLGETPMVIGPNSLIIIDATHGRVHALA